MLIGERMLCENLIIQLFSGVETNSLYFRNPNQSATFQQHQFYLQHHQHHSYPERELLNMH